MNTRFGMAAATTLAVIGLAGCADMTHREKSVATGAAVGGVVGNLATDGSTLGTVGGAVVGGVVGNEYSKRKCRDRWDRDCR